jgi:ABC-2 type transport system ATP-binding protein
MNRRGLEPNAARDIRAIIADLAKQGVTIFLTTHCMEEADQLSAPVAVIDQGRIVARCSAPLDLEIGQACRV